MAYVLVTDTSCNLPDDIIEKYNIEMASLSYFVNGEEYKSYEKGKKTDLKSFYTKLRNKEDIKTSLASPEYFTEIFERLAKEKKDILCISFSSGLSGTCQSAKIAAQSIREKYPDIKLYVVDSLSASLGEGLVVYNAALLKEEGKTIDEVYNWVEKNKLNMCHWFTVDDLFFLKRGGRISASTAVFGTMLGIKPLMHTDNDGKLTAVGKIRGRKQSLNFLVEQFDKLGIDKENQVIAISHGDCIDDAMYVINEIKKKYKLKDVIINYIDAVIGSHSGPGTVALFFMGSQR